MGGGFLHPHLPGSGNDRGRGGCIPRPQGWLDWGLGLRLDCSSLPSSGGPGSLCLCAFTMGGGCVCQT